MEKHDHSHHHHHENDNCDCPACKQEQAQPNWIKMHQHDDAAVISARCTFLARPETAGDVIAEALQELAAVIAEKGGIIGHIKATLESTTLEMFSLTDRAVSRKKQPNETMTLQLVAIVFLLVPEEAKKLVEKIVLKKLQSLS
ncbi:MAG: hypothetical protein GX200_02565 [Firmicutes bacterium]|nr:hypothetical protein [Bacillota bacterium]